MNGRQMGVGIVVAGTVLLAVRADGAEVDRSNLVVRAYLPTTITGNEWKAAVRETTAILADAGVDVGWIRCAAVTAAAGTVPAACAQPLQSNEITIRVVRAETHGERSERPLGESLLDPSRRTGTLATIYLDRVEWLAGASRVSASTVLARAIAHEIGHLLLGTTAHTARGLMRPVWTREELIRARAADWLFPARDATRLQHAVARRLDPTPESVVTWSDHR